MRGSSVIALEFGLIEKRPPLLEKLEEACLMLGYLFLNLFVLNIFKV